MNANPTIAPPTAAPLSARLALLARDIKLSHTVFAMPFALLSTFMASGGWPAAGKLLLILICMATARTVAMTANRLLDAELDARNPRTSRRAIPSGQLTRGFVRAALAMCAISFIAATALFELVYRNPWPLLLSVPVLLFVSSYPFLKRFTRLCHYYLGTALGLAPVCAWIAIRGDLAWPPVCLAGAVLTWTAGFDIIYACQDYAADLQCGLFSVPAKLGIPAALWVSRLTHACSAALLITLGLIAPHQLGALYFIGVALAIALLITEQSIVRPGNLSKVNLAFFTINGIISLTLGTLGIVDVMLKASR